MIPFTQIRDRKKTVPRLEDVFTIWRLVEDERVIVDGPMKCSTADAVSRADDLTNATGKTHCAVIVGCYYESLLLQEPAAWLEKLLRHEE